MTPDAVPEQWDFYPCRVDDGPASIFMNFWYREHAPLEGAQVLYWVRIDMVDPDDHGMGTRIEAQETQEIEAAITMRAHGVGLFYVGRLRNNGRWQLTFYGPDGQEAVLFQIAQQCAEGSARRFELSSQNDEGWSYYFDFLCPDDERERWMDDRRLVEALKEHGDPLNAPRRVDHWAYFASEARRDEFIERTRELGFEVDELAEREADEPAETATHEGAAGAREALRHGARIFRRDHVSLEHIHEISMRLVVLAKSHDGDYDGWETSVERADTEPAE